MGEVNKLRDTLLETAKALESLAHKEKLAEQLQKMAIDSTSKITALEAQIKVQEKKLNSLNVEKDALLAEAKKQADLIIKEAEKKNRDADLLLASAKQDARKAQDALVSAENARLAHEQTLKDVQAQREKLRAVLVS